MSDGRLDLTVLGCATPYPAADNPCSGYLVSSGGAGSGRTRAAGRSARSSGT